MIQRVAGVPDDVMFQRKWEIALQQLDDALQWGARKHVVLADAAYGDCDEFRAAIEQRGMHETGGVEVVAVSSCEISTRTARLRLAWLGGGGILAARCDIRR